LIQYSNNKHVAESIPLNYQNSLESTREVKTEKKDKKKNQVKGTVADYKLQNRGDDYYLGYMSKDVKNKFRFALDMKYILDNVKPTLRGSNSLKSLTEDPNKKSLQPVLNTQRPIVAHHHNNIIREETDDELREAAGENVHYNKQETIVDLNENTMMRSLRKEETLAPLETFKKERTLGESIMIDSMVAKNKMSRQSLGPESPRLVSNLKASGLVLPKIDGVNAQEKKEIHHHSSLHHMHGSSSHRNQDGMEEVKRSYMAERLKFSHAANKKLGKGRFFVSLTDHQAEPDEDKKGNGKRYYYADRRKLYVEEHDKLIKKDTDSNIEGIVRALMVKQNRFQKEFSRKK